MKSKIRVNGVDIVLDDGDKSTSHIMDMSDSPELCAEAEEQRLQFLKRQVKSLGYKIVDKNGKEI